MMTESPNRDRMFFTGTYWITRAGFNKEKRWKLPTSQALGELKVNAVQMSTLAHNSSVDLIIVPVHLPMHWVLVIVDKMKKKVFVLDSLSVKNPYIIPIASAIAEMFGFAVEEVEGIDKQTDSKSCGAFVMLYAERAIELFDQDGTFRDVLQGKEIQYHRNRFANMLA